MKNFILIQDKFLSVRECNKLIKFFKKFPMKYYEQGNYYGVLFEKKSPELNSDKISFMVPKLKKALEDYYVKYPELVYVDPFYLSEIRFKHWKGKQYFSSWHSEHSYNCPHRILNCMIYLSTHNCGTKFLDGSVVKSEKGRLILFPSYFTHTHKGMPCPDKKDRYMFGSYFNFKKQE